MESTSLEKLIKKWHKLIPYPGKTYKKSFPDRKYHLSWTAKYNHKRMLRRSIPTKKTETCPFCLASQSQENVITKIDSLVVYGNKYPIEELHLLLFSANHNVDPQLPDLLSVGAFLHEVPSLKVLISNRRGSGASIPDHNHIHAFHMHLPIEDARKDNTLLDENDIEVVTLLYPAWTIRISYNTFTYSKLARIIVKILNEFPIPFNIVITDKYIFIIPRAKEDLEICKGIVDGVGSLETAGVYTTITKEALTKLNIQTFRIGLEEASFKSNISFQQTFLSYLTSQIKSL